MHTFWQDVRFGLRMLRSNPGFTVAAVLCLTLGIGATTSIFSVVNAVLLRPLPYARPGELIRVYTEFPLFPNGGLHRFWTSAPEFLDLRRDTRSWQSLEAWVVGGANLAGEEQPVRVPAAFVSGGTFQMLGVSPLIGRAIQPDDDKPGENTVVLLSFGTWKSVYGGRSDIVGRETLLNGQKATIVGVMPKDFAYPPGELNPPQVWTPLQIDPAKPGGRGSHFLYLLGRLKPGVTAAQAQSELESLEAADNTPKQHTFNRRGHTLVSFPLHGEVVAAVRPALLVLLGAVAFVLLIACVNVANLLLARAEARRREIAIRSALGAGVARLARQFATEGVLLAVSGAVVGLGLAFGGLKLIQVTNAGAIPRAAEIGLDWRVLLFTLGISVVTGILFGLAPLFSVMVADLADTLKETAGSTTGSAGAQIFRRALVCGEIALALVLLIGCGLMLRAFWRLQAVNAGLNPHNVVTMRVVLPGASYKKPEERQALWQRLEERLRAIPGVQSAALASGLPPLRAPNMNDTEIEGFVQKKDGPIQNVDFYQIVGKDYFSTMGVRLMEGRLFEDRDGPGALDAAIVNQSMARTFWPGQSPIGRRVRPSFSDPWCTVIGVVEDVKNAGLDHPAGTEIYLPYSQKQGAGTSGMYIVLRAKGDPSSMIGAVRSQLMSLDPTLPLSQIRLMDDVIAEAQSRPRFLALLLSMFSVVALSIAAVGIYGVISYSVARRTREFGLRMVLGAQPADVVGLVMRQGFGVTLAGIVGGLIAAFALTRLMVRILFETRPTDPATFAVVTLILGGIAMIACYVPARRATRVDPAQTLRYE
jgi:putative ABC transport system permease protein